MTKLWFAIGLICSALALHASDSDSATPWVGRILIVDNPAATTTFVAQPAPVREMVKAGVTAFTGKDSEESAWLSLVSTNDKIGIKVHSSAGASGTRLPVVEAVIQGLLSAGISSNQIVVWDRRLSDLRQSRFFDLAERLGVRIAGALEAGYDDKQFYETALLGRLVYGDREFGKKGDDIGRRSYVSTLIVSNMTKIISIVPLLNHNVVGTVGHLHGMAMGSVDNVLRFELDPDRLGGAVPEIYALEPIVDHVVLNITDALISQYQGEEKSLLHYSTAMNELWFSKDPVALDVLAIRELSRQRKEAEAPPLRANMDIFTNAAVLDLGVAEPQKFRIERLTKNSPKP